MIVRYINVHLIIIIIFARSCLAYRLRSSSSDDLLVPAVRLPTVGRRAFLVAGTRTWNDLPVDVTSAPSLHTSRKRLKLRLFRLSYPGLSGLVL